MKNKYRYNTVTSAIDTLRLEGFTNDFTISEEHIASGKIALKADDLNIKVLYRYEGNSDPADEASVYGLESKCGLKGILVLGDEINSDVRTAEFLKKLHQKNN
jgi:hypothetical protein